MFAPSKNLALSIESFEELFKDSSGATAPFERFDALEVRVGRKFLGDLICSTINSQFLLILGNTSMHLAIQADVCHPHSIQPPPPSLSMTRKGHTHETRGTRDKNHDEGIEVITWG